MQEFKLYLDLAERVEYFNLHWKVLSLMPIVACLIGYVTKLVAIRMMFEPLEFMGIKPYLGWQGIIPRKAETMAAIACDTMTSRLISPEEIFNRLDPERIAKEIQEPMMAVVEEITHEILGQYQAGLWESLPDGVRKLLIKRIQDETPAAVAEIMEEIKNNLNKVFDLKHMVITNLVQDKPLLNRIFRDVGYEEFRFIANSGIYFGFAIGMVQLVVWMVTRHPLVMPLFGGFTGWSTDWLALKMIFEPKEEKKYFCLVKWQGLFLKRRKEVAGEYGKPIAKEILTPSAIIETVLGGPLSDNLFTVIQRHVKQIVDEQSGLVKPLVVYAVGSNQYQEMKRVVAEKIMDYLPETTKHIEGYAADALDIENTLITKMRELTADEFEGLLRPAFQQDEWILITVGAVLGFLVGEFQVFVMLPH